MTAPQAVIRPVKFTVDLLPDDVPDRDVFTITIEERNGRWGIFRGTHRQLGADLTWSWGYAWNGGDREPATSDEWDDYHRGRDAWLNAHRFDLDTARRLAGEAAPHVKVMGTTAAQVLADHLAGLPQT